MHLQKILVDPPEIIHPVQVDKQRQRPILDVRHPIEFVRVHHQRLVRLDLFRIYVLLDKGQYLRLVAQIILPQFIPNRLLDHSTANRIAALLLLRKHRLRLLQAFDVAFLPTVPANPEIQIAQRYLHQQ